MDPDSVAVPAPVPIPSVGVVQPESAGAVVLGEVLVRHPHGHEVDAERCLQVPLAPLRGPAPSNGRVPVPSHRPAPFGPVEEVEARASRVRNHRLRAVGGSLNEDVRQVTAWRAPEPVGQSGVRLVGRFIEQARRATRDESGQSRARILRLLEGCVDKPRRAEIGMVRNDPGQLLEPARTVPGVEAVEGVEELHFAKIHTARGPREQPEERAERNTADTPRDSLPAVSWRQRLLLHRPAWPGFVPSAPYAPPRWRMVEPEAARHHSLAYRARTTLRIDLELPLASQARSDLEREE